MDQYKLKALGVVCMTILGLGLVASLIVNIVNS